MLPLATPTEYSTWSWLTWPHHTRVSPEQGVSGGETLGTRLGQQLLFSDWSRTKSCAWTRASLPVRKPSHFGAKPPFCIRRPREKTYFCTIKAMLHGAIFLATCNTILLLRDVKLPNTSLHDGGSVSQVVGHRSRVTGHRSRVTGHRSQVTGHRSRVTGHRSQVTGHMSRVTGHRSRVTGHRSRVTGRGSQIYEYVNTRYVEFIVTTGYI
jgi:hypothetical protein